MHITYTSDNDSPIYHRQLTNISPTITDYGRATCGLQSKMDYTKIKEMNITMCYQLYFTLKYSAFEINLNN